MTRFTTSNPAAAAEAVAALPAAVADLVTRANAATAALDLPTDLTDAAVVLDALVAYRRGQAPVIRAENEVMRLLRDAGASPRGIGNALNINRETVARRIALAETEREVS
ncbi:hypothetical protein ACNQR7_07780 [Mycolicibacterium senegalense]|uniref:hypothetical protein n=1 Tax=Mycolicibacterium senegalense TaxID=1796 RepID=UPI003AAE4B74